MKNQQVITVSLAQMDIKIGNVSANLATMKAMTASAATRGYDLVAFHELWSSGYDQSSGHRYVTPTDCGLFAEIASRPL